ncbi:MAG: SgcJ/EcaC family oxidoreductase [Proteobacteria bacterium]|nr:SgcJ/EcaC family oxidoreductase [Pseudomonadota bacterium]
MGASAVVQAQLDAYNAQDLEAFCACFSADAVLAELNGEVTHSGREGVRRRYADLFAQYPKNRAELINRIAGGDVVVDEERIERAPDQAPFRAIAIYTVKSGLIARVDFVR